MMRTIERPLPRILAALALVLGLSAPAGAQELELLEPGTVKCAFSGVFAPFSMQDAQGAWDGLTVRIFREAVNRLGLKLEYVVTKWESLLVGLLADQYDILCDTMDITKERQEQVLFVDGWLESGGRLVVHKDSDIEALDQFKGKKMGVLVASTWAELAKPLEPGETKYYQTEQDAMQDVVNQKLDGMITDSIAAAWAIEHSGLPLRIVPGYLSRIQKGFAAKKDHPNLVRAMNEKLAEMIADGTYAKLTEELIGYSPNPAEPIRSELP
jgi:polar amino acid transport system substrate-binding protein